MTEPGKESVPEVPEVEEAFSQLLLKFRVGTKDKLNEFITENIARTGGEMVFEDPLRLAERLATWHESISPVKRKQIIEQWFAEKNIQVPKEAFQMASISSQDVKQKAEEERRKAEEAKTQDAKFSVDVETGRIRPARADEKALTLSEAETLSSRIKSDKKADEGGAKEPIYIMGPEGAWTLNPKATIGAAEFAVFQMYQESLKRGQPIDPIDELTRREEQASKIKEALGIKGKGEDSELSALEKLQKLGLLKAGGGDLAGTLATLESMGLLRKPGSEGESETVKTLRKDITNLKEALDKKDREALTTELTAVKGTLASIRQEIEDARRNQGAKGEYDIMTKALDIIDRRMGAVENTVTGFFRKPPPPLSKKAKKEITEAIVEEVESQEGLEELGAVLWGPKS